MVEAVAVVEVAVVVPEAGIPSGTRKLQQEEALEEGGGWVASEAGEERARMWGGRVRQRMGRQSRRRPRRP